MTTRILFVCLGNICRSPLGEGILRQLVEQADLAASFRIDSAGTGAYHQGEGPDPRSIKVARKNGVSLEGQSARKVEAQDFDEFDLILAMDRQNLSDLRDRCPPGERKKLRLMRSYEPEGKPDGAQDVPDPYFGGRTGFDDVFTMLHRCCRSLLASLTD